MKNSGVPLHKLPRHVQDQVAAQLYGKSGSVRIEDPCGPSLSPDAARLRQRTGPALNKTEAAFLAYLQADPVGEGREILAQSLTLLIANGCRYTPDFFLPPNWRGQLNMCTPLAYEVKGFMRDDAAVKIKVAARVYPWIRFFLATRRKRATGGGWAIQEILP